MSNTFTREQLHQYFGDRYTPEQVNKALQILAENSESDFDPYADEFSVDITSELEEIFDAVGRAIASQQTLEGSQQITKIGSGSVTGFSASSNPQLMAAMMRLVVEEGIDIGASLSRIKNKAVIESLKQGDMELARTLYERNTGSSEFIKQLADDDQRLNKMLSGYGVGDDVLDIDAFLIEVQGRTSTVKNSVKAISASTPKTFDIDAFLLEALLEAGKD